MAKRVPLKDRPDLIRKPEDWARDWGWVSRRRAVNLARKIDEVATVIDMSLDGDDGASEWSKELRRISKSLAPTRVPAEIKRDKREVATMQEP